MHRPHPAEAEVAEELAAVRPDLLEWYAAELPDARAAVLTRLWRALAHEPLPWITGREPGREGLTLRLRDGRRLHGPTADPYATAAYVTVVRLDGEAYDVQWKAWRTAAEDFQAAVTAYAAREDVSMSRFEVEQAVKRAVRHPQPEG